MADEPKVKVRINAVRQVRYTAIKEIPLREFEEYKHRQFCYGLYNDRWFSELADKYIDPYHQDDSEEYEDVELFRVGPDNKRVEEEE